MKKIMKKSFTAVFISCMLASGAFADEQSAPENNHETVSRSGLWPFESVSQLFKTVVCTRDNQQVVINIVDGKCLSASFNNNGNEEFNVSTCEDPKSKLRVTMESLYNFMTYEFVSKTKWKPRIVESQAEMIVSFSSLMPNTNDKLYLLKKLSFKKNNWVSDASNSSRHFNRVAADFIASPHLCKIQSF
jgi:hypothetical protein